MEAANESEKILSFSVENVDRGIWAIAVFFAVYGVKFLRWFLLRELFSYQEKAKKETADAILSSENRIEAKLMERDAKLEESFAEIKTALKIYKIQKHNADGENQVMKSAIIHNDKDIIEVIRDFYLHKNEKK